MLYLIYIVLFQRILYRNCLCDEVLPANKSEKNGEFMDRLFDGYSKSMLPVLNFEEPVLVNLSLFQMSIDTIENKHKIASARIIFGMAWIDEYLRWNSSDFKNLTKFSIEPNSIWLPDVFIGNQEKLLTFIKKENVQDVTVNNNGFVQAWLYLTVEVGVDLEIHEYPFDTQVCKFEFSSWTHNDRELVILDVHDENDPYQLRQSGEWDFVKMERSSFIETHDNYTHNFTVIQYKFTVKRRWLYTILNLVAPVVLTSFLNPLSFLLPVDSGERISLTNTVFLTLAVFFSIVNSSLPQTSEGVPVIVAYIGLQMVGSVLTIVFTICSLALYYSKRDISKSKLFRSVFDTRRRQNTKDENGEMDLDDKTRESQNVDRNEVWKTASNCLDKTCFWLSLMWNVALFLMVFIHANVE